MKKIFAAILLFSSLCWAQANPESITIGFLPGGDEKTVKSGSVEIAKALQEELGIPVNVYISKNYTGLIEAMKSKKVDFAFFTALTYVFAEKEAGAKVLLKSIWEGPFYHSAFIVKKDSKIRSLADLKGKKIAFVDEKSTSGYLYPQVQLKKLNIVPGEKKLTGSHSQSVELLDQGKVDAIAVFADDTKGKKNAYVKYSKQAGADNKIRILWTSDPIPTDPFCVRQDFYDQHPKLTHNLMFALIDVVDKLKNEKNVVATVGAKGFVPATQKQYDSVREVAKELDLRP